jgi:hypothetical protein
VSRFPSVVPLAAVFSLVAGCSDGAAPTVAGPSSRTAALTVLPLGVPVNEAPVVTIVAPLTTVVEGVPFDLLATMDDDIADLNYAATWTFGGRQVDITLLDFANRNELLSVRDVVVEDVGPIAIALAVTDRQGGTGTDSKTITVEDSQPVLVDREFVTASPTAPTGPAALNLIVSAGSDADRISSIEVNWGDGLIEEFFTDATGLDINGIGTAETSLRLEKGAVTGGNPGYNNSGPIDVQIFVNDEDSFTGEILPLEIANDLPVILSRSPAGEASALEGQDVVFAVAASDASLNLAGTLSTTFVWAHDQFGIPCASPGADCDGNPATDTIVGVGNPSLAVVTHAFPTVGRYIVAARVEDEDGGTSLTTFNVLVGNIGPSVGTVLSTGAVDVGATYSITVGASAAPDDVLSYAYNFDCAGVIDDADFVGSDVVDEASATTTFDSAGLFTVCVRVCDEDDEADSCAFASAEVTVTVAPVNVAPPAPDALSPANGGAFASGTAVTLEARAVIDANGDDVTYTFEVAASGDFETVLTTSESRDLPFVTLDSTLDVGSYFWRARASDGELNSAFGTTGTFSITATVQNNAPTAPTNLAPDDATIETTTAVLTITAGTDPDGDGVQNEFEVAPNAAFATPVRSGLINEATFTVGDLAEDATYFWRARTSDGTLVSEWTVASFVVNAVNAAPTGLAVLAPTDGAVLDGAPTEFVASIATDAEGDEVAYEVILADNAEFSSPIFTGTARVIDGVVRIATPTNVTIEPGVEYFWQVTASDGTSTVSASASFSLTGAVDDLEIGGGCACGQSSTNPAAPLAGLLLVGLRLVRRRR